MTLKIEVDVPYHVVDAGDASAYLDRAFGAIGFIRHGGALAARVDAAATGTPGREAPSGRSTLTAPGTRYFRHLELDCLMATGPEGPDETDGLVELTKDEFDQIRAKQAEVDRENAVKSVKRERGKPAEGRTRRTKAEIAEDEAADALEAADVGTVGEQLISTGENRLGPEDDAETEAQDRADEQAETEANRNGQTLDDLRNATGAYQRRYGMAACVADTMTLLGKKMLEVTDDELPAAIQTMTDALESNPMGREIVGKAAETAKEPVKEPEKPAATKADVIAALMDYALKYDGQNTDTNSMPVTMEDGPKVLQMIFGDGIVSAGKIPASPENYAKAVAGINEMLAKNPFRREAK